MYQYVLIIFDLIIMTLINVSLSLYISPLNGFPRHPANENGLPGSQDCQDPLTSRDSNVHSSEIGSPVVLKVITV